MKYYKVKKSADNTLKLVQLKNGKIASDGILIANELYTECEYKKLMGNHIKSNLKDCFQLVEIPKTKTYWFFGARFEMGV